MNRRKALSKRKKTLRKQRLAAQLKYQRPKDLYPILACLGEPDYDAYVRRSIRLFQLPQLKLKGQTLIQNLQSFADSLTRSEATKEAGTHRRSDLSVDFEAAVREIYGFFDAWGRCCEKLLPSKLRLRIQDTGDAAKPAFIFLLTTHPHQSNLMKDGRSWKEINMSMVPP